jgi:hypothetical protein
MKLTGENRSTRGENLSQCHFAHHKSHVADPGSNPGLCGERQESNRLSHGTAFTLLYFTLLYFTLPYFTLPYLTLLYLTLLYLTLLYFTLLYFTLLYYIFTGQDSE